MLIATLKETLKWVGFVVIPTNRLGLVEGVRNMQISKQPQNFSFHFFVILFSLKRCVKELNSKCVQTQTVLEKPTKFTRRKCYAFPAHFTDQRSVSGAESGDSFTCRATDRLVELLSQLSFAIHLSATHASFQC